MKRNSFIINEEYLSRLILKTIKEAIHNRGQLSTKANNIGTLVKITDAATFKNWAPLMWDMLEMSYEDIGGLKSYRNYKDFYKKRHLADIIIDNSGRLLACATYRRMEDSLKMVAIGCNQQEDGKIALQQIIQSNIIHSDLHYWAEVSGAIEHYFKKHNGYPMPNTLASEILGVDNSFITPSTTDKVHYDRPIGAEGEIFTKMIFGIKSEAIFQKAMQEVENYSKFMQEVNSLQESAKRYSVKQAIYIIENIYRAHEEDGFNELIPSWYEALKNSLATLQDAPQTQATADYIGYCEYLLSDMQLLELHVLNI